MTPQWILDWVTGLEKEVNQKVSICFKDMYYLVEVGNFGIYLDSSENPGWQDREKETLYYRFKRALKER